MIGLRMLQNLLPFLLVAALPAATFAQPVLDPLRVVQPGPQYARKASATDLYEKQAGQVMLKSSHNPEIRKFAQTMIADHARSAVDLRRAAAKSGITINPELSTVEFKEMIGKLNRATAEARDALYVAQQRSVLQRALILHHDYAASGDQPALRETAARIVPMIQSHIDMLAAIVVVQPAASGIPVP